MSVCVDSVFISNTALPPARLQPIAKVSISGECEDVNTCCLKVLIPPYVHAAET